MFVNIHAYFVNNPQTGGIMYTSISLEICIALIFLALGVFLWHFFKAVELQLKEITYCLQQIHEDLDKLERNAR